jgi:hypothetical protein
MFPIQHDDLNDALNDPFNGPSRDEIPYNFGKTSDADGSSIYIYPGIYDITKVRLEYIKKPRRMFYGGYTYIDGVTYPQTDCELPEIVHNEIVDLAVLLASEAVEHPNSVNLRARRTQINE